MPDLPTEVSLRALKLITTAAERLAIDAKNKGGRIEGLDDLESVIHHIIVARDIYERLPTPSGRELQRDLTKITEHLDKANSTLQRRVVIPCAEACLDALRVLRSHWY